MKHTLWGVDIASTILLLPLQIISFSVFLVNHCSMSNDCKMLETPLSWDSTVSSATAPQPCPLSWPLKKGVLAIFLQVYNVNFHLMLVDLMSSNWATFCMKTLVQTIPSCEIVMVLCVALKSCIFIRTLSKLENQRIQSNYSDNSHTAKRYLHKIVVMAVMLWIGTIVPEPTQ